MASHIRQSFRLYVSLLESWYEHYTTGGGSLVVRFNFLPSITSMGTCELLRRKRR